MQTHNDLLLLRASGQIDNRHRAIRGDEPLRIHAHPPRHAGRPGRRIGGRRAPRPIRHVGLVPHQRDAVGRIANPDFALHPARGQVDFSQRVVQVEHGPQCSARRGHGQGDRQRALAANARASRKTDRRLRIQRSLGSDLEHADRAADARRQQSLAIGRKRDSSVAASLVRSSRRDLTGGGIDCQDLGPIQHGQPVAIGTQRKVGRPAAKRDLAPER